MLLSLLAQEQQAKQQEHRAQQAKEFRGPILPHELISLPPALWDFRSAQTFAYGAPAAIIRQAQAGPLTIIAGPSSCPAIFHFLQQFASSGLIQMIPLSLPDHYEILAGAGGAGAGGAGASSVKPDPL